MSAGRCLRKEGRRRRARPRHPNASLRSTAEAAVLPQFFSWCLVSSQLLEESADGVDAAMEVGNVEFFVGSVEVIVGQAEAHHYAGNFQDVLEVGDNWDGAAAADEDCFFLECIVQGFSGGFDIAVIGTHYAGRALAPDFDLRLDAFGCQLLHEG